MIAEAPPQDPRDNLNAPNNPAHLQTTLQAFNDAGKATSTDDLLNLGIYFTTAIKCPKTTNTITLETINNCTTRILEHEINLLPNLKTILLMGDTAIKALNLIAKRTTGKPLIPNGPTYKLRKDLYHYKELSLPFIPPNRQKLPNRKNKKNHDRTRPKPPSRTTSHTPKSNVPSRRKRPLHQRPPPLSVQTKPLRTVYLHQTTPHDMQTLITPTIYSCSAPMQKSQTRKYAIVPIPPGLWKEVTKAVKASGIYTSEDEFIREAIREKLQQLAPKLKKIPEEELEQFVLQYLQQHEKAYAADISNDLEVPYLTVAKTLNKLVEKGLLDSSYY